ncbi:MAG: sugar phosphate isomerase/epimerase [Bryobacteraceae bacterium]|nr:sugar phosphate isomerase/epimerase [Bryobacteraceae bacterium]
MTSRRVFLALAGAAAPLLSVPKRPQPLGLQIYSLRREAAKDLPATFALIRKLGFQELEAGSFYGRKPAEFQRLLADNGLRVTSWGAEWDQLSQSTAQAIEHARLLGAEYVMCSSIPRRKKLSVDDIGRAADNFNRWGEALAGAGLRFCYHPHGPEFVPGPDGTLFDTLAKRMDPRFANFEMDVFWVVFGNQDPVTLLERYSGRFPLMHVKDIRKGEPRTFDPGTVEEEASVPLGAGEIDWPPVLRASDKHGVKRYYIEEEHPDAVNQIRQTLAYLENLRW